MNGRVMEDEDIGLTPCMEGDHEWRFEWPEWDVGFYGFKECENCGKTAALEAGDCEFEEYE
jgi:hypothetical protein